jgi:hypothetical protein
MDCPRDNPAAGCGEWRIAVVVEVGYDPITIISLMTDEGWQHVGKAVAHVNLQ